MLNAKLPAETEAKLHEISTIADKIRLLNRMGYKRADIARILDKRYQHVRNVLERDAGKAAQTVVRSAGTGQKAVKLRVAGDGTLVIPADLIFAIGLSGGDAVSAREENGEIKIISVSSAVKKVQALVRALVPENASMADELIAERHAEAQRENAG